MAMVRSLAPVMALLLHFSSDAQERIKTFRSFSAFELFLFKNDAEPHTVAKTSNSFQHVPLSISYLFYLHL
jgi:hypothetical protein